MSEIRANTVSNAAGTGPVTLTGQYAAKVWVNFNGTGTVAIRESGNVSSITDGGTGIYTVNFASALSDANYAFNVASNNVGAVRLTFGPDVNPPTSSTFQYLTFDNTYALQDAAYSSFTATR